MSNHKCEHYINLLAVHSIFIAVKKIFLNPCPGIGKDRQKRMLAHACGKIKNGQRVSPGSNTQLVSENAFVPGPADDLVLARVYNELLVLVYVKDAQDICDSVSSQFENEDPSIWENFSELIDTVCELRSLVYCLLARVSKISEENLQLKGEVRQLETRIHSLEIKEQRLILGQLAFTIERGILTQVMESFHKSSIYTIRHMEKAIRKKGRFKDRFESEEERKSVEDSWGRLKLGSFKT